MDDDFDSDKDLSHIPKKSKKELIQDSMVNIDIDDDASAFQENSLDSSR